MKVKKLKRYTKKYQRSKEKAFRHKLKAAEKRTAKQMAQEEKRLAYYKQEEKLLKKRKEVRALREKTSPYAGAKKKALKALSEMEVGEIDYGAPKRRSAPKRRKTTKRKSAPRRKARRRSPRRKKQSYGYGGFKMPSGVSI